MSILKKKSKKNERNSIRNLRLAMMKINKLWEKQSGKKIYSKLISISKTVMMTVPKHSKSFRCRSLRMTISSKKRLFLLRVCKLDKNLLPM